MSAYAKVTDAEAAADRRRDIAADALATVNLAAREGATPEGVRGGLIGVNAHGVLWLAAELRALRIAMTATPATHSLGDS